MSLIITGTDTEVGKTVVSALIAARYGQDHALRYWKPVASGLSQERDVNTVVELSGVAADDEVYAFTEPVSPHLAARLEKRSIEPSKILRRWRMLREEHPESSFIIEGAGGVHVPLDDEGYLLSDLFEIMALPTVVVARSTLGTINHTLLTLEALRGRKIPIAGVVLNGPPDPENCRAIGQIGQVEILGQIESQDSLDRQAIETLSRTFDVHRVLEKYLG